MKLRSLLAGLLPQADLDGIAGQIEVTGVTTDPQLCSPGFIYVAAECETVDSKRYGVRLDGRDYIDRAVANGAAAVITSSPPAAQPGATVLVHDRPLSLLGPLCARIYADPRPRFLALVTGTNGKTSVVNFCRMLWAASGLKSASIGNLGGVLSDNTLVWGRDPVLSTPETVTLHKMLNELGGRGCDHVAMEATSHALFDYRLHGSGAQAGAFTNLTRDHLDFHGSIAEYFRVKMLLFAEVLEPGSSAILNADSPFFDEARSVCRARAHRLISYGRRGSDVRLTASRLENGSQVLALSVFGSKFTATLPLPGEFQASNALCALAIVIASGLPVPESVEAMSAITPVEGRLNVVARTAAGACVVVDYAHTPDGLDAALRACRTFTNGKLLVVFSCNGERDPGKRPLMGEVAATLADEVIITDGHPRHEDAGAIRRQVLAGAPAATEVAGRARAIALAVARLAPGDTLLIAGLGHETYQVFGSERLPHSDTETVRKLVAEPSEPGSPAC